MNTKRCMIASRSIPSFLATTTAKKTTTTAANNQMLLLLRELIECAGRGKLWENGTHMNGIRITKQMPLCLPLTYFYPFWFMNIEHIKIGFPKHCYAMKNILRIHFDRYFDRLNRRIPEKKKWNRKVKPSQAKPNVVILRIFSLTIWNKHKTHNVA